MGTVCLLWWCYCYCCCNGWWQWLYMQESVTRNYDGVFCFCLQSQLHVIIFWIDVVIVVIRYKVAHFEPLVFFTHNFINGCNGISEQWRWYQRRDGHSAFAPYSLPCFGRQSGGCGSRNISSAFSHGSSNLSLNESAASKFDKCAEIQHALFFSRASSTIIFSEIIGRRSQWLSSAFLRLA